MKYLCLIRHAKSSWEHPMLEDFERPLNARGKKDAPRMARRLKERGITPGLMYSSPAKRAKKTCQVFAEVLGIQKSSIHLEPRMYHADDDTLLEVLHGIKDKHDTLFFFGHNPGLTEFANLLSHAGIINIPTTGVVHISFRAKTWNEVRPGKGKLLFFDFPKKNLRKEK